MKNTLCRIACITSTLALASQVQALKLGEFDGTQFSVGGYIKGQAISQQPEDGDATLEASSRQSRINFKTVSQHEGHTLVTFVEGDFRGDASQSGNFRLRHAFAAYDNYTVGQTWSGQFWAVAHTDLIDFYTGPRGTLAGFNFRPTLFSYKHEGLRISLQDPIYTRAATPDAVVNYDFGLSGGNKLIVSVTGREMNNEEFGLGVAIGAKLMLGSAADLRLNLHSGEGLGAFTGVGANLDSQGGPAGADTENDEAVAQTGANLALRLMVSDSTRMNLSGTRVEVDDSAESSYSAQHFNLIHKVTPALEVGIELRYFNQPFVPSLGIRPKGDEVEVMAKLSF